MDISANTSKNETIEYKNEKDNYIINLIFNSEQITFNIKKPNQYHYSQYESKFSFSELKQINSFFSQFSNVEKIGKLYTNLLNGKKITLEENQNEINLSFMNITEEKIQIIIKKKELSKNEKFDKLSEIVENLIKDIQELKEDNKLLKEENKKIKEELNQLNQFKLKIEQKEKEKEKEEEKYYKLENSSIIKDKENVKMISNWIMPNKKIKYTQIYKATRDGGTGQDFHRYCDNKGPTLTLFEATNGYIFGGYISISWEGPSDWTYKGNDNSAFIFSVNNKLKFPNLDKSKVIYNQKDFGPDFGSNDIYLNNQNFLNNNSSSNNYPQYKAPPEKVTGGSSFRIKELEVYLVQFD